MKFEEFNHFGSKILSDGRSCKKREIKNCSIKRKSAWYKKTISLKVRENILGSYAWSVALFENESWTTGKRGKNEI